MNANERKIIVEIPSNGEIRVWRDAIGKGNEITAVDEVTAVNMMKGKQVVRFQSCGILQVEGST